ncbi:hypothetical protein CR513_44779, partial [Mucuna pruriens]
MRSSKSIKGTTLPLFQCLRKNDKLQLTDECKATFQKLKNMLATPLILTRPIEGMPILIYLSISNEVGAKTHYQKIAKVSLALIIITRKLRSYFQSHVIIVKIELLIKHVLRKPDLARRMVGWYVELSEFDISYERRWHIKEQVMTDFITKHNWMGSEARIIFERSDRVMIEKLLRFEFRVSNNKAKYETLLARMKLAKELGWNWANLLSKLASTKRPRNNHLVIQETRFVDMHKVPPYIRSCRHGRLIPRPVLADCWSIDFFTKWIKVELVATITVKRVRKFTGKKLICCFSLPLIVVLDKAISVVEFCSQLGIKHSFTSIEHPQTMSRLVLWSYHTTSHLTTHETLYRLTFGADLVISMGIGEPSLQEVREVAHAKEYETKARVAKRYDAKGNLVLRKMLKDVTTNKLTPNWEGPFRVVEAMERGAFRLERLDDKEVPRPWNSTSLCMHYN